MQSQKKRQHFEKLYASYPDVVTSDQLRQMLGCIGRNTVQELLCSGAIRHYTVGRQYFIPKSWVIDYVLSRDYEVYRPKLRGRICVGALPREHGGKRQMPNVIAIANQKGGVGKTTTAVSLGVGLANAGKRGLPEDCDQSGDLTIALACREPDSLPATLSTALAAVLDGRRVPLESILRRSPEGLDYLPSNVELAGTELTLIGTAGREKVLREYLETAGRGYDFVLLDCAPSLGMMTVNALAAANGVLIPVQAEYLSAKGLEQLLETVSRVKYQINPKLRVSGILLTMTSGRTNVSREITGLLRETYGGRLKIYDADIPRSVRAAETSAAGRSIYIHDPNGRVAEAYRQLTKEVLSDEKKRQQAHAQEL